MNPTAAMLITRLEHWIAPFGCIPLKDGDQVSVTAGQLRTLLTTIRELEVEAKKRHKKPSYAERGKPRYYAPE